MGTSEPQTADTQAVIEEALANSISSWWQTPPRLDLAAQAVAQALAAQGVALRTKEAGR